MRKYKFLAAMLCLLSISTTSFAQNNPIARMMPPSGGFMPGGGGPGGMMPMGGHINQFDVAFATQAPIEQDVVIKNKKDSLYSYFVENVTFKKTIKIAFSDNEVAVTGNLEHILHQADGAYLTLTSEATEPLAIELSGNSSNGGLALNLNAPAKLLFNHVVLKSQRGEAILVESKTPVYAVMAEGSVNELSDCRNPELPPMMMGFPLMGDRPGPGGGRPDMGPMLDFGSREMRNREENPEDYHEQYGIRMKKPRMKEKVKLDGTFVCAGQLTISGKGSLQVQSNNKVGIKSKESLMLRPGNLITVRALAGKGVNAKSELYVYGGALNVDCSFSGDKALTCGRNMYFKGGHTVVKAAGGESSEGVESKFLIQIDGGKLEVAAQDDAIDSNCNILINGGDVFASGASMPEGGLDSNDEAGYCLFINGGSVIAIGGRHSMPEKQSRQPSIQWRISNLEVGKSYSVGNICTYPSARDYSRGGASLLFSAPQLKKGSPYSLCIDEQEVEQIESLAIPISNVGNMGRRNFPF